MQDLVNLLHQSISSIGPDCDIIRENIQASRSMEADIVAAIESRVNALARRAEHIQFCNEIEEIINA